MNFSLECFYLNSNLSSGIPFSSVVFNSFENLSSFAISCISVLEQWYAIDNGKMVTLGPLYF